MYNFSISLMCISYLNIRKDIKYLNDKVGMYHVDIMDGAYCDNFALSPQYIHDIKQITNLPIDVHLMVNNPLTLLDKLIDIDVSFISVHVETINKNAFRVIRKIKESGCGLGIVLNPATPLDVIESFAEYIDLLTIMTVDIGSLGQPFIKSMLKKIDMAKIMKVKNNYNYIIQADGCCNGNTFYDLNNAGVENYVIGSSALGDTSNIEIAYEKVKKDYLNANYNVLIN